MGGEPPSFASHHGVGRHALVQYTPLKIKTVYQTHHQWCANQRWAVQVAMEHRGGARARRDPRGASVGPPSRASAGTPTAAAWPGGRAANGARRGRKTVLETSRAEDEGGIARYGALTRAVLRAPFHAHDERVRRKMMARQLITARASSECKETLMLAREDDGHPISRGGRRPRERRVTVGPSSH